MSITATKPEPTRLLAPDPDAKARPETPMTGSNYEQFSMQLLNATIQTLYLKGTDDLKHAMVP